MEKKLENECTLAEIQAKVKAPKGQFNSFGKYNYRSAEDILEAVKQVVNPMGYSITISDTIINVGDRYYIKATATLSNGKETWSTDGYAREEESKKGMDGSQVTGAASSYARKYSLSGLFGLDDTKDSDATNTHGKEPIEQPRGFKSIPTQIPSVPMNPDELDTFEYLLKDCNNVNELELLWGKVEPKYKGNLELRELFSNRKKQIIK